MRARLALVALTLALAVSFAWAAQDQTTAQVVGLPPIVLTAVAQDAEVLATDEATLTGKAVHVIKFTDVDGEEMVVLVRVQRAINGLFLDLVAEATIGELTTRVAAMEITGHSHPSTEEDAADSAALAAATE